MARPPRTPPRKEKVRGDAAPKKGLQAEDPTPTENAPRYRPFRAIGWCLLALLSASGYLLFRLCQTPRDWPVFPLAEVGPWPLEQKLYNALSTDRSSTLEVPTDDINRHLARHLLAHHAIGTRSPSLEAVHVSGTPRQPVICGRFRWNLLPFHLRATASRINAEQRNDQNTGYSITEISVGTLPMPTAIRSSLLKWFNPLMATLKREKYLLKRSTEISTKPNAVVFHVSANPGTTHQPTPQTSAKTSPQKPAAKSQTAPSATPSKTASPPNAPSSSAAPKALPPVPKAERVP
jgi:hypothetical protein